MLSKDQYRTMVEFAHEAIVSADVRNGPVPGTAVIEIKVSDTAHMAEALKAAAERVEDCIPLGVHVTVRAATDSGRLEMLRQLQWD